MAEGQWSQSLVGTVVHGQRLGHQLGFPTANLNPADVQVEALRPGVYAAWATLEDGSRYRSMVNIGYRPTVDKQHHTLSIEAHLHDFEGDLYDKRLRLDIVGWIRDERRMESLDQLKAQLTKDLSEAVDRLP